MCIYAYLFIVKMAANQRWTQKSWKFYCGTACSQTFYDIINENLFKSINFRAPQCINFAAFSVSIQNAVVLIFSPLFKELSKESYKNVSFYRENQNQQILNKIKKSWNTYWNFFLCHNYSTICSTYSYRCCSTLINCFECIF